MPASVSVHSFPPADGPYLHRKDMWCPEFPGKALLPPCQTAPCPPPFSKQDISPDILFSLLVPGKAGQTQLPGFRS